MPVLVQQVLALFMARAAAWSEHFTPGHPSTSVSEVGLSLSYVVAMLIFGFGDVAFQCLLQFDFNPMQTVDMVVQFGPAERVKQVMAFQSHNQYPQLKESDAINDITAKTCQSETSTTNLNESFETCCLFFPASSTRYYK